MKKQRSLFITTFLLLILAMISQISLAVAGEIPGYIGQQSFRLSDDRDLSDLTRRAEDAKVEVARVDQTRAQIAEQVAGLVRERDNRLAHMNDLQRSIDASKGTIQNLSATLAELSKNADANKDQIAQINAQIATENQKVADLSREYGANKLELGPINVRLDQVNHDLSIAAQNTQNAMNRLNQIARDRDNYLQNLISSIQQINREGGNRGQVDGTNDGGTLSYKLGNDIGSRDGDADGLNQGTLDGQDRYYRSGADQGERDGSARARNDGQRDGTNEGIRNGNSAAGAREGRVAGLARGDASNAAAVGIDQGKKAGLDRAARTGSINGNNLGENQTVQKFESGDLNSLSINGPFAGSFQRRSPEYPGDFNGPSFNPNVYNNRDILKRAYADGYLDQYRQYTKYEYLRRIDTDYNAAYDNRYASTYDQASKREYPDYYNQGRKEADARAYSRDYPIVKAQAYQVAFNQTNANPSRSSGEYTSTYKSSELQAFNERFEQIRRANFERVELEVFNANIAAQTEIYRQKRISEVTTVYNNNAVLAFVNSEIADGGISGVAKLDGIFQPGETTLHTLTIRNFGLKTAENVSVQLDNGAVVKLPSIAARSLVKIVGAGQSIIASNAQIGSTAKTSLRVLSKLTSNDVVEAAHFDSIGSGVLKSADVKAVQVAYPLSLSGLSLGSQLLKGVADKLSINVTNNSKRAYTGELKIHVTTNSNSELLTKDFSALSGLQTTIQASDAQVLVTDEKDVYRNLVFSATITQNGVTLGVIGNGLSTMAKAQYLEKDKAAVLVANSDKNLRALLDALDTLGGTENVSVLDLSLASLNEAVLSNGLNQKVLLIVDDENGSNIKSLNNLVAKSKASAFVFIDENNTGLKNAKNLAAMKDAQQLPMDKKVILFSNPQRADGVVKSSALFQSSLQSFEKDLTLANDLTQSAADLIARFKTEVNRSTFFTPNAAIKMFSLKALSEVLCINKVYDESGHIFTRDKKWVDLIGSDKSLFINVLKAAAAGDVTEAKLSVILPAIAVKDTLSYAMANSDSIYKLMMMKITSATNDVLGKTEDGFKKNLKNFSKDLYNKAYEQAYIHRPFFIEAPRNNNGN
jgi:flagellar biosynthesis chaperone FliJ